MNPPPIPASEPQTPAVVPITKDVAVRVAENVDGSEFLGEPEVACHLRGERESRVCCGEFL